MKRFAWLAALCVALIVWVMQDCAIAGSSGTVSGYTNPGSGWTADVLWTVSSPDGAGTVTLAWSSTNGKHGSKLVRGNENQTHAVASQQGDIVTFSLTQPNDTRWNAVSLASDVTIR